MIVTWLKQSSVVQGSHTALSRIISEVTVQVSSHPQSRSVVQGWHQLSHVSRPYGLQGRECPLDTPISRGGNILMYHETVDNKSGHECNLATYSASITSAGTILRPPTTFVNWKGLLVYVPGTAKILPFQAIIIVFYWFNNAGQLVPNHLLQNIMEVKCLLRTHEQPSE